ncbi:bifunctional 5,10-methylenetetrahydrofolate dehydrogenase/5,10-methenyltetrahydrofolate cyclohydrolase [TM7 phylum sp. oral taxon 352]|nr:bifunctional 5,10-methylenetetrahydrofolate dehydrogenase/5,10-methenyltetrahydrofolate cyclohydrolase [TM7 phylum sp. oral taxon 352]
MVKLLYLMTMRELNGSELAGFIKERQAKQVRALRQAWHINPRLAIVTDVENPVIETYMRLKQRYGADILIDVEIHRVPAGGALEVIQELNNRDDVQGIILQLPISNSDQTEELLESIREDKDVDGLRKRAIFQAATPTAISWLLAGYGVDLKGKKVAIVGRGRLVGAPLEKMWLKSDVDVTVFEKGDDLSQLINYDIIVSATGVPGLIKSQMIKTKTVVVDAGTASENGKIVGDVSEEVRQRNDVIITPKKGGVGPLTVSALFDNVITACLKIANQSKN